MKSVWFFYIFLGIVFVFCLYMATLGNMEWWHMVYYIVLAFLGLMGLFYPQVRWFFITGIILGLILLVLLYKYNVLYYENRFPFIQSLLH